MKEDVKTFETWLHQCIEDAKEKLHLSDKSISWILLREFTAIYFRQVLLNSISDIKD